MDLNRIPSNLTGDGAARVWRALRVGDRRGLLVGAGMLAFGWWRRTGGHRRRLIDSFELRDGEALTIKTRIEP